MKLKKTMTIHILKGHGIENKKKKAKVDKYIEYIIEMFALKKSRSEKIAGQN